MSASHPSEAPAQWIYDRVNAWFAEMPQRQIAELVRDCIAEDPAARSPAPTLKHPDQFLVRIERPGGVRFMEATAPTLEEAAEGVGLQRRAAPSVEARDADDLLNRFHSVCDGLREYAESGYPKNAQARYDAVRAELRALLPPEKT